MAEKTTDYVINSGVLEKYNGDEIEINIPNEVKEIASYAFYANSKIKSVIIPNSVVTIGESAFMECQNLESVVIGNGIEFINASAFANCSNLREVIMPKGIEYVSSKAFYNTEIRNIWQSRGFCTTCGGKFKGVLKPKCSDCQRVKDY